jgi:SAM-dependent methyltransferase
LVDATEWDERYAAGRQWSREPNRFFAEAVGALALAPGRAIDLACGEGRNALWLATLGWDVTAVDFSAVGVERGRAMAAEDGVHVSWVVADLAGFDLGFGAWDLVAHVYLHWPTAEREPFLQGLTASLAPGGHLVLVGHDRTNIEQGHGGPQDPDVLTTPDELAALFASAGLDGLDARIVTREVLLDASHLGTAQEAEPVVTQAINHLVVARRPA